MDENEESEVDLFALNAMIPNEVWDKIKGSNNKEEIALKNNIPLCFLYSRLAKEGLISYRSKEYNNHKENI